MDIPIEYDLAHLKNDNIKDSRITTNQHAFLTLNLIHYYPHIVGHKANYILILEIARANYHHKLEHLSKAKLNQLFSNITTYSYTTSHTDKIGAVINQAVKATQDWQTQAIANHHPIYTGPSGYVQYSMLNCSHIFLNNINPQGCAKVNHFTLKQLCLILLTVLIDFNQHHIYNECMVASHRLTRGGVMFKYTDCVNYHDIINSADPFVCNKVSKPLPQVMITIGKQFIVYYFKVYQVMVVLPLLHLDPLVAR
ncbi:hypothetical protein HD554DRAFT_2167331 [Boletus coccyginus]|nr:hypothetical protein HD554DRAFT_2167331 [Boletus coccyginus]